MLSQLPLPATLPVPGKMLETTPVHLWEHLQCGIGTGAKLAKLMRDDDSLMKLIRKKSSGNAEADKLTAEKGKAEKVDYTGQLEKLQEAVKDCLDVKELTPLVLNKLIDRIEVGSQEVVDGQ